MRILKLVSHQSKQERDGFAVCCIDVWVFPAVWWPLCLLACLQNLMRLCPTCADRLTCAVWRSYWCTSLLSLRFGCPVAFQPLLFSPFLCNFYYLLVLHPSSLLLLLFRHLCSQDVPHGSPVPLHFYKYSQMISALSVSSSSFSSGSFIFYCFLFNLYFNGDGCITT